MIRGETWSLGDVCGRKTSSDGGKNVGRCFVDSGVISFWVFCGSECVRTLLETSKVFSRVSSTFVNSKTAFGSSSNHEKFGLNGSESFLSIRLARLIDSSIISSTIFDVGLIFSFSFSLLELNPPRLEDVTDCALFTSSEGISSAMLLSVSCGSLAARGLFLGVLGSERDELEEVEELDSEDSSVSVDSEVSVDT